MTGPNWQSSVLIITYDESDGHFDHVPPPQPDPNADSDEFIDGLSLGAGFRVPTFVISPWTFGRGICSDPYDHTSILRFLEEVTLVPCPNLSNWRRQTFKSLSSLTPSFASSAPIISVPARPDAVALQTNAINRYQGAPNKQDDNTVSNWQPTLSPSNLVPTPQNWPPVAQGCQVIMTIPSYSQGQVQDQAQLDNSGDTATFPNAFIVVVDGFEPIELTTLNAIAQIGSVAAASPPTNVCATRIPAISITDANGNPIPNITSNITVTCTQIDFDPNNAANQTQSGVPRRFTFTFSLTFQNINDAQNGPFSFGSGEIEQVWVNAAFQVDVTVTSSADSISLPRTTHNSITISPTTFPG